MGVFSVKINDAARLPKEELLVSNYNLGESYRLRRMSGVETIETAKAEDATLRKVQEVKNGNVDTTLDMMDRHNEMVKKSQELYKAKAKQRAIERQNTKRREEHSELLAEMALRNAQRREFLESDRFAG
jgi:hypothetical protein